MFGAHRGRHAACPFCLSFASAVSIRVKPPEAAARRLFTPHRGPYTRGGMSKTSKLSFDIDAVVSGAARLTDQQAMELYHNASLHDLGQWALAAANRIHPEDYRTYVIDRNINYTNVCTA